MFNLRQRAIANKIRNDPYYRFQSLNEIAIAVKLGLKIDVNHAGIDDWLRLPGFSIHQAKLLVEVVKKGIQLVCIEDIAAIVNIPLTKLLPLEPILYFAYYDPISTLSPRKINLNRASVTEIEQIPLWDEDLANVVFNERNKHGNYRNILDLQSRLNLDNDSIAKLIYYVEF